MHGRLARSALAFLVIQGSIILVAGAGRASDHHEFGDQVRPGVTELVSVASNGTQGNASSGGGNPSISDDGRFVAFSSCAGNLDERDVNGRLISDVFLHDRKTRKTSLISLMANGSGVAAPSGSGDATPTVCGPPGGLDVPWPSFHEPAVSGNGRYVAFTASVPLDQTDDATLPAVYVHDRKRGINELITKAPKGYEPLRALLHSRMAPAISDDGRHVSFLSTANPTGEQCPVTGCGSQLYVFDRKKNQMTLASRSADGDPSPKGVHGIGTGDFRPSLSDNGRVAVFVTAANLTPDDQNVCALNFSLNGCTDVYLRDLQKNKTELISVGRHGTAQEGNSYLSRLPAQMVSANGRFVLFESTATQIVPHDASPVGGLQSIYVRDRKTKRTERITASTGEYIIGLIASLSDDGRFVLQRSSWSPFFGGQPGAEWCCGAESATIRHDRRTGQTDFTRIHIFEGEHQSNSSGWSMLSGSGRHVVWDSTESHGLKDENEQSDVFFRDLGSVAHHGAAFLGGDERGVVHMARSQAFARTGIVTGSDARGDALGGGLAGDIIGGRVAHRPALDDLYLKLDVGRLADVVAGVAAGAPLVYGFELSVDGTRYEVRLVGFPASRFGLFRCHGGDCTEIAQLRGGYGTAGESVIAAVPLDLLRRSGKPIGLSKVRSFSAVGTYDLGVVEILDELGY